MTLWCPPRDQGAHHRDPAEIIYQRRVAVFAHGAKTDNVATTCRTFGILRTRYYEWEEVADPAASSTVVQGTAQAPDARGHATHVVEWLLALAVPAVASTLFAS